MSCAEPVCVCVDISHRSCEQCAVSSRRLRILEPVIIVEYAHREANPGCVRTNVRLYMYVSFLILVQWPTFSQYAFGKGTSSCPDPKILTTTRLLGLQPVALLCGTGAAASKVLQISLLPW